MTIFLRLISLPVLLVATTAHSADLDWGQANSNTVRQHIVPVYKQMATGTARLEAAARDYCQPAADMDADRLRAAYHAAMDDWMAAQHLRFGRVQLFLRYHRYQLWPDKHNTGNKQLYAALQEQDEKKLEEYEFSRTSVALQGFTALERLLFAANNKYLNRDNKQAAYACRLLQAIGHNLALMSKQLHEEWADDNKTPFQKMFVTDERSFANIKTDSPDTSRETAARLFSQLTTQLEFIADQKLGRPMDKNARKAKPRRAESWRSDRSLRNIIINLKSLEQYYLVAFSNMLQQTGKGLDAQIKKDFAAAIQQAQAFGQPLAGLVRDKEQHARLQQLEQSIRRLKGLLGSKAITVLQLPQMFNALDGD